jgi:hypothetical protein
MLCLTEYLAFSFIFYAAAVSDVPFLQQRTKSEFYTIRTTPGTFQEARQSLFRGATSLVEARGGHFEHFI